MPKFIVELNLDGYTDEEEMTKACEAFIEEQLNFSASSVKVERFELDHCASCGRVMDLVLTCPACGSNMPDVKKQKQKRKRIQKNKIRHVSSVQSAVVILLHAGLRRIQKLVKVPAL